jgi:exopolysaccharide biosynthesis polyprenyl glycosylphosphotransferase
MSSRRRNDFLIPLVTVLSDVAAIEAAFMLSYWLRFYSPLTFYIKVTQGFPRLSSYVVSSFVFIPVWLIVFRSRNLYGARRNSHLSDEFFSVVRVVTIGLLITMSATFFYRGFSYSRVVFVLLWITAIVTITSGRFLIMELEKYLYRSKRELKTVAIVGNNSTAEAIFTLLTTHLELGYEVVGYYAESPSVIPSPLAHAAYRGDIARLSNDIAIYRLQSALIAISYKEHPRLADLLRNAEGLNIEMMMVPDMLDMMTSRVRIHNIEGIPFIKIKEVPLTTWNTISKRSFDIIVSSIILLITLPLTATIAAIIKISSNGSMFYIQERVGLDGVPFSLVKFRTMQINAEQQSGPVRAVKGDPRTTLVGKILRRASLDELPQLWNVLKGDMSIVGPRPERPFFVSQFKSEIPRYLERHRMKAGMTGWAQVNGLRGNAPISERTKYDIYYVENWSLIFDIKIILKTVHAVLFGKDAY